MKAYFSIALFACVAISATVARPGGYTAIGGVYEPAKEPDYMNVAKDAGKLAWNHKLEDELVNEDFERGARETKPYIPTFFTQSANHQRLVQARPQVAEPVIRRQRESPAVYQTLYHS